MLKKIMPAVMAMFLCAAVSHAEESITIQILHKSFPNVKAEKAGKSVIPGLYEVEAGNNVFYFEPRNGYLIFGDIITKEGKNLTAEKRQELLARRVKEIPLEKGIKIGDGKNVVIEFTDPDCPFCRKAADWLEKNREGVTRYVFLYPITRLHPGADAKAKYILGAKDQEKAYLEVMSGALDSIDTGKLKLTEKAGALLEEHKQIAVKAGVFATPTLWVNGKHVPGADIPLIEKYLKGENDMKKHPGSKEMLLAVIAAQGLLILFHYGEALAVTAPSAGSFAYDVYDIGVNSILKGPIGFIGGVGAIVFGAIEAIRGRILEAVPAILGGAALLKADSIVQTLGCII